jgi:hypothetical protein
LHSEGMGLLFAVHFGAFRGLLVLEALPERLLPMCGGVWSEPYSAMVTRGTCVACYAGPRGGDGGP